MGRTDAELALASRRGDTAAYGELVVRYQRAVTAVAYAATRDRTLAEDIAQDAFVTGWRRLATLGDLDRLPAWLCGIARNLARGARRKRGREVELGSREASNDETPFDAFSARETDGAVAEALAKVPAAYREPLVLYYCEAQPLDVVARALGISEGAAHQRLSRGRKQLAGELVEWRPRRDLAAAVVAAIAVLGVGASQVEAATTTTKGTGMIKLGIAAALALAIGGAGYAVTRSHAESGPTPPAVATTTTPAPGPEPEATPSPHHLGFRHASAAPALPASAAPGVGSAAGPADCAAVVAHMSDLVIESQPDAAQMTPEQQQQMAQPVVEHLKVACDRMHWSQDYMTCMAGAQSMFDVAVGCAKYQVDMGLHGMGLGSGSGMVTLEESTAPIAPYTGDDVTCGSVGQHLVQFSMPSPALLLKFPADQRDKIAKAIEKMQKTIPDQIEASCAQGSWGEAKRRCLLAATTFAASQKCL